LAAVLEISSNAAWRHKYDRRSNQVTPLASFWAPAVLIALSTIPAHSQEAIKLNPENPKYFLFRGKPRFLLTVSEHYGSVMNWPFDFIRYLDDAASTE
jgi:hypothetical protein